MKTYITLQNVALLLLLGTVASVQAADPYDREDPLNFERELIGDVRHPGNHRSSGTATAPSGGGQRQGGYTGGYRPPTGGNAYSAWENYRQTHNRRAAWLYQQCVTQIAAMDAEIQRQYQIREYFVRQYQATGSNYAYQQATIAQRWIERRQWERITLVKSYFGSLITDLAQLRPYASPQHVYLIDNQIRIAQAQYQTAEADYYRTFGLPRRVGYGHRNSVASFNAPPSLSQ